MGAFSALAQVKQNDTTYLHNKIFEFYYKDSDSLIFYSTQLEKVAQTKFSKACGILGQAKAYYQKGELDTSENFVLRAIDFIGEPRTKWEKINFNDAYRRLFYIKKRQGNYDKAIFCLQERERLIKTLPQDDELYYRNILDVKKCFASIKIHLGLYQEALDVLKDVNKKADKVVLKGSQEKVVSFFELEKANILNLLGTVYSYLHEEYPRKSFLDSASVCFRKAYDLSKPLKKISKNSEAFYRLRTVDVYLKKKTYQKALEHLYKYDSIFRNASLICQTDVAYRKAIMYLKLKQYDSSVIYSKKYINSVANRPVLSDHLTTAYDNLANSYVNLQQNDSALKYSNLTLKNYRAIEKNKKATIKSLFTIELEAAETLNEKLLKAKKRNYLWMISAGVLILGLTIGVYLLFLRFKRKDAKHDLSKENSENSISLNEEADSQKTEIKIDDKLILSIKNGLEEFEKTDVFLKETFSIITLAKQLDTNTTYLSQVINTYKKKTFKQYLSDLRINYVIEKLHSDKKFQKYSIESIGKEIGYSNASAFTRAFKKKMGVTPSQYIKEKVKID